MTVHGIIQQSHSVPPQSQPKQGFVVALIGLEMVEVVEEVEGGMVVVWAADRLERASCTEVEFV